MEKQVLIDKLKDYFNIYELVDKATYNKFKDKAWGFFDYDTLLCLLIIREGLGRSMTINNWYWNGQFSQRGLRTNICSIVKKKTNSNSLYLSGHVLGKGFDFDVKGMTAEEVRMWIVDNADLFPCKVRLEHKYSKSGKTINWVHLDTVHHPNTPKIYLFNV